MSINLDQKFFVQPCSFIVFIDTADGLVKARNGKTQAILSYNADAKVVFSAVETAIPQYGLIRVQHNDYLFSSKWSPSKKIRIKGEGSGTRLLPATSGYDAIDPTNIALQDIVWRDSNGIDHDASFDPNTFDDIIEKTMTPRRLFGSRVLYYDPIPSGFTGGQNNYMLNPYTNEDAIDAFELFNGHPTRRLTPNAGNYAFGGIEQNIDVANTRYLGLSGYLKHIGNNPYQGACIACFRTTTLYRFDWEFDANLNKLYISNETVMLVDSPRMKWSSFIPFKLVADIVNKKYVSLKWGDYVFDLSAYSAYSIPTDEDRTSVAIWSGTPTFPLWVTEILVTDEGI